MMDGSVIRRLLPPPAAGSVGVIGDFCTDVYWEVRPDLGERSIETGLTTTPVENARYSPGGAGNIVANLRGIGLQAIPCFGAVGSDPFGLWLREELMDPAREFGEGLQLVARPEYHTPVYCKPLLDGVEGSRFDLGDTPLTDSESLQILAALEKSVSRLKVLIVNQQMAKGLHSACFREGFAAFVRKYRQQVRFVFDGRNYLDAYPGVTLKINQEAASRLAFGDPHHSPPESGRKILAETGEELIITDGENGSFVIEQNNITHVPAIAYTGPVDTVGAGDSFCAGTAYALANGSSLIEAAQFGTCCSAVTIRKLNCTGAPSPAEMLALLA